MRNLLIASILAITLIGCTRIETGEIGLRIDASKQIQGAELQPGSWNQTLIGSVLTFPVRDIAVNIENKTPITADNSALADFDVLVSYGLNPSSVSDLWTTKSRSFHAGREGDIFLMENYVVTLVNNAAYKAVREFKTLEVVDKRAIIEEKIKQYVGETLRSEKLDNTINLTLVQIRAVAPNAAIIASANAAIKAENELKVKSTEVEIAKKEAERMEALAKNGRESIDYMNAQSLAKIAQGIENGKVQTIVVPYDFKGIVNVGK
jgi:hypothetical protein